MTIEEYERRIKAATDATNAAQAQKNAAEAAALSSVAINAATAQGQKLTGGVGEDPEWQSEQEQVQNQQAVENAVQQTQGAGISQEENKPESSPVQKTPEQIRADQQAKINADAAKRSNENLIAASKTKVGEGEVRTPDYTDAQAMSELHAANAEQNKLFSDIINDYYNRKKADEEEMARQEKANMYSTMGTGFAELGAGIINMLSVGSLHASNQQYHEYSQDWMKKADADIREHRKRRDSMYDTLQRLKMQQQQVRSANKIEEMKYMRALQKEREERERYEQQRRDQKEQQEWQRGITEQQLENQAKAQERQDKQTNASIAQGWSRIQNERDKTKTSMLANGWVPDKNAPGGFRYDPKEAQKLGGVSVNSTSKPSGSGNGTSLWLPVIDSTGKVNFANVRSKEQKELIMRTAVQAIKNDLGDEESKSFEAQLNMADNDKTREEIISEWIGKSQTMEQALTDFDPSYQGNHGEPKTFTGSYMEPGSFLNILFN